MTTRRSLLAAVGAAAGAGCLGPAGDRAPTEEPPSDPSPSRSPTDYTHTGEPRGTDGCTAGFDVTAEAFDPAGGLTVRPTDRARELLAAAVETGSAETTRYGDTPPVADGVYVEHDGAFYETTARQVDATEVPALVTNVEWEDGQQAPAEAEEVAFADLPAADRGALRFGIYGEPGGEEHGHPSSSLRRREVPLPYPDGTADSALAGDGETWVRRDGRTYRVWIEGETTMTRHRFRISVAEVAGAAEEFRDHVADEYLVDLSGLAEPGRAVLRAAVEDRHEECEPASDGLAALRDRLPADARLPPPQYDAWYVAFEGERYLLSSRRWVR